MKWVVIFVALSLSKVDYYLESSQAMLYFKYWWNAVGGKQSDVTHSGKNSLSFYMEKKLSATQNALVQ